MMKLLNFVNDCNSKPSPTQPDEFVYDYSKRQMDNLKVQRGREITCSAEVDLKNGEEEDVLQGFDETFESVPRGAKDTNNNNTCIIEYELHDCDCKLCS